MADKDIEGLVDEALEAADELIVQELPEILKDDAKSLKKATSIFLSNIQEVYEKIEGFNAFKKAEHKLKELATGKGNPSLAEEYQKDITRYKTYKITEQEFKLFMSQFEKFQIALNQYLGKTIKTIYLYKDKDTVEVYELIGDLSDAVVQDIASRGGGMSARYSASQLRNSSVFEKIVSAERNGDDVTKTYLEVIDRGEHSRAFLKKNGMLVFWYPNDVFKKMFVAGGAGDIGEAYLSFMLDDVRMKLITGSNMENDIDVFMLQGVKLVDNISGLLKGDFSVGSIDYAAKAESSSVMGYRQVIKLADEINKSTPEQIAEIMTREYEKILKKERTGSGRRNKMIEKYDDTVDNIIEENILNRIKSDYTVALM